MNTIMTSCDCSAMYTGSIQCPRMLLCIFFLSSYFILIEKRNTVFGRTQQLVER